MMNKKANIPVTILVVGTIAVCIVALIAFHNHRNGANAEVSYFRHLEVMNNVKEDMEFSGEDLEYVLEEFYPSSMLSKVTGYRNYRPFVEELKEEDNYLVYRKMKEKRSWLIFKKETDEVLIEIKLEK